jgi:hypothetical protein
MSSASPSAALRHAVVAHPELPGDTRRCLVPGLDPGDQPLESYPSEALVQERERRLRAVAAPPERRLDPPANLDLVRIHALGARPDGLERDETDPAPVRPGNRRPPTEAALLPVAELLLVDRRGALRGDRRAVADEAHHSRVRGHAHVRLVVRRAPALEPQPLGLDHVHQAGR